MQIDLSGHRAFVGGGSQGIGHACAVELARAGAVITLVARNEDRLASAASELSTEAGQEHRTLAANFEDPARLRDLVERHLAEVGDFTILLNNTGGPPGGPIFAAEPETFLTAIRMHVICNQVLAQLLVPGMKRAGYGRIINIISTSVREPIPGLGVSNTTRGAVASWAKSLSQELGSFGITVNNILPGYTNTARLHSLFKKRAEREGISEAEVEKNMIETTPARRLGEPEEIAAAATFLASPAAAYVNGVSLPVDGGRIRGI